MIKELLAIARSEIKPFHDDPYLKEFILSCQFSTFFETGTFRGDSIAWLAEKKPEIDCVTVESNTWYYRYAKNSYHELKNIQFIKGDSREVLDKEIRKSNSPILFWLDSHWQNDWPLLDELKIIFNSPKPSIVLIDDFKVPNHPCLGYDSYQGQDLDIDYLRKVTPREVFVPNYDSMGDWRGYALLFHNIQPFLDNRMELLD